MDPLLIALISALTFLVAGTIKGLVGMGLPTVSIATLTLVVDPRMAISLTLIPMVLSNAWQVWRAGDFRGAWNRYWIFLTLLVVSILVTLWVSADASPEILLAALGVVLLVYVALNLTRWKPRISNKNDKISQVILGAASGIMGGLVAVWAPPMGAYLSARDVNKDEFVRATGFLLFLGSIPLTIGYVLQGHLTRELGLIGLALIIPTFAGFALGERLRALISEAAFRNVILAFFAIMGANLLRRALL